MVLSDKDIISSITSGELNIEPYESDNIEPASVDLRLGREAKLVHSMPDHPNETAVKLQFDKLESPFTINPQAFVLATTLERE